MAHPSPSRAGFQFSLKTFLITLVAAGTLLGLLGRLFFYDPNVFQAVAVYGSTLLSFLFAIGTILAIGVRARRKRLIVWSAALFAMPFLGFAAAFLASHFAGPSPGNLGVLSTRQLIDQRLPNEVDQPRVWRELERRIAAGSLSQQDAEDALGKLISHMTTTRPAGWDQPLHWQRSFVEAAATAGLISDAVRFALADAFYGPQPVLNLPRVRERDNGFDLDIQYGNTWNTMSGLDLDLVWRVERVLLDGQRLPVQETMKHGERWSGHHRGGLPAGEYELTVEIEAAYVDRNKLIGLNVNNLPPERWPAPAKRWKRVISAPLVVNSDDVLLIQLAQDARRDPQRTGGITVERLVAQTDRDGGTKIITRLSPTAALSISISFDVAVRVDGRTVDLGRMWAAREGNSSISGGGQGEAKVELDQGTQFADIILTPNPKHIEGRSEVTEIWGKEIVLRNVPLERLDLTAGR